MCFGVGDDAREAIVLYLGAGDEARGTLFACTLALATTHCRSNFPVLWRLRRRAGAVSLYFGAGDGARERVSLYFGAGDDARVAIFFYFSAGDDARGALFPRTLAMATTH